MTGRVKIRRLFASTLVTFVLVSGDACSVTAQPASFQPLTTLRAIHLLSNTQASHQLPVSFEATVTYYRPYERTMFVQDGDVAIYVQANLQTQVSVGDRVLIKGTTHESFRPFVSDTSIAV